MDAAARSEDAARHPRLPGWYFPLMALAVAAVMAGQMLPSGQRVTLLGAIIVVILMVNRHVQSSSGIVWDATRLRGQVPFLIAIFTVIVATAVVVAITEIAWAWLVGGAVGAVVVLVAGAIYTRTSPGDA